MGRLHNTCDSTHPKYSKSNGCYTVHIASTISCIGNPMHGIISQGSATGTSFRLVRIKAAVHCIMTASQQLEMVQVVNFGWKV